MEVGTSSRPFLPQLRIHSLGLVLPHSLGVNTKEALAFDMAFSSLVSNRIRLE